MHEGVGAEHSIYQHPHIRPIHDGLGRGLVLFSVCG